MGFQVAPERVGRRRSLAPGIAVAIACLALIGFGLASGSLPAEPTSVSPEPYPTAAAVPVSPAPVALAVSTPRPYPGRDAIDCHDAGIVLCGEIAGEAVEQLPADAPTVESVGVWTSILCRDDQDCPASRFEGYRPLGSAIVRFGRGWPRPG